MIVVIRQAATARAFVPLLAAMRDRGVPVELFTFDVAFDLISDNFPEARRIASFADAAPYLDAVRNAAILLTGSSEFAADDASFWEWARRKGIPSVAFVDSWVNYYQRFSSPDGVTRFDLAPDHIAVVDQTMQRRLAEHGCDPRKVIVTGNPLTDELTRYSQIGGDPIRQIVLRAIGGPFVLFVAEPFNERVSRGSEKDVLGYTEADVASQVIASLQKVARERKTAIRVVIKPHPRQPDVPYAPCLQQLISAKSPLSLLVSRLPALDLAANAVFVVGMTSLLLYEAAVIGVPVVSYQPDRNFESDITDGRPGISVVMTARALDDAIARLWSGKSVSPRPLTSAPETSQATERFLQLLDEISANPDQGETREQFAVAKSRFTPSNTGHS